MKMNTNKLHSHRNNGFVIALSLALCTMAYASRIQAASDPSDSIFQITNQDQIDNLSTIEQRVSLYIVLAKHEDKKKDKDKDKDKDDDNDDAPSVLKGNIIAIHNRNSRQYKKKCTKCHTDIRTRVSLDPAIPDAHVAMLPFSPGKTNDDRKCTWCHRTVDLIQAAGSPVDAQASIRKHVDSRLCTLCHGPSGPGKQFFQVDLSSLQPSGELLYDLVCSGCHRAINESQVRGESASDISKAILKNKGGMAPLNVLTQDDINAIADALVKK